VSTYEEERARTFIEREKYDRGIKTYRYDPEECIRRIVEEWPLIPHKAVEIVRTSLAAAAQDGRNIVGDELTAEIDRRAAIAAAHDVKKIEEAYQGHLRGLGWLQRQVEEAVGMLIDRDPVFARNVARKLEEKKAEADADAKARACAKPTFEGGTQ